MEAIREFKVVTNEYDVTNGRAGGGTISTVTKSGTNQLTGSAFTYLRSDWLSSKYDIRGNKRSNDFSTYQFGASLGGALVKTVPTSLFLGIIRLIHVRCILPIFIVLPMKSVII